MRIRVVPASQFHPSSWKGRLFPIVAAVAASLFAASPANAHHLMDGRIPRNGWEGFLSGFAHPVIGLDHLAFIIAIGLLSAVARPGLLLAVGLVFATIGGTAIHLIGFAIPGLEFIISASVLLFGILLAVKRPPCDWLVLFLAAIVGIFHGYAYGEAIFGAETQPLIAYLIGFACVQLAIVVAAYLVAKTMLLNRGEREPSLAPLRPAGLVICGIGLALLSSQVLDAVLS